ncbi:glycerophosphodiester phosphodiesterase [Edaphobacillus lindanitolerans]|uniref:Glycerophosphoryl diester phosphodiesterase n=1 Tax=Edaphobacillus lindanitolerans TaxID=550447 RepID=A0A1U7PM82_9BACI|nr:glycerophosphodiester phosphodiesterase family protein [Edaphobacillus lindanitolerans]SIT81600.1 glycerophosphoryl diester phosphodiesterase [Edaphobacillus lindanitolerans]
MRVFAHRGASGSAFENTRHAFEEAVRLGADGIETDVQLTSDGVPVIVHDADLYRVTGMRKFITELTAEEAIRVRLGKNRWKRLFGERLMTLRELVSWASERPGIAFNIEVKETFLERPEALGEVIGLCRKLGNVHLSSFHYPLLVKAKWLDPAMETALIATKKSNWDNLSEYSSADAFHIHKRLWSGRYLEAIGRSGKVARVYGVDGTEPFIARPEPFVSGWITDYPEQVHKAMKKGS